MKPLIDKIVKGFPKLIVHDAAPAVSTCRDIAPGIPQSTKDNPIGVTMPVTATPMGIVMLALRDVNEVDKLSMFLNSRPRYSLTLGIRTDLRIQVEVDLGILIGQ